MATSQVTAALAAHPFLEGLQPKHYETLAGLACEVSFEPGQIIFREGDPSSFFYLILSGTVALEIAAPGRFIAIHTVGEGEELGWSSLLDQVNKQFRARSVDAVRALAFDGARIVAACESDHEFGYIVLRKVLEVVAERLRATRLQVLDVYSKKGAPGK
ncbi:MAG: Crp/Fnr family transcriptional regulator [Acidobacteria bacterium]|nr:Crp/Fnr family transcriptional regulator [Acidobacteriota bacterium]